MLKVKQDRMGNKKFILYMIIFRASLDYLYVTVLNDYHKESYLLSYVYHLEFNIYKYLISWLLYLFTTLFLTRKIIIYGNRASELIILGLYIMSFVPSVSLFGLANLEYKYLLFFSIFWVILLGAMYFLYRIKHKKIKIDKKIDDDSRLILWYGIVFVFCIGVLLISWKFNGLRLNLTLDPVKVYELRTQASSYNMGLVVEYFRHNAMYVINPFAGLYFFQKKNWIILAMIIYIQLLLYSIGNQKAALFLLPASILAYLYYKENMINRIPTILIIMNLGILLESIIGKSTFLVSTLLERIYYIPAILSNCYYEYFVDRPPIIPFVSFVKQLGLVNDYQYDSGVPYIIGELYFYNSQISANTGMFGSAFSYGLIGIIFTPIAYSYLFILLDKVSNGLEVRTFLSILILQVFVITGATIFVVVTVYGYFVVLLLLALVNKNSKFSIMKKIT
ncbi:hypothetical protein [Radiobacillus deserti]|uniref:Oligosaccharide repeat unit polymerase n=1 Tax=Radiobacillus deserti TaxID=2594883 RepID=A0A516KJ79_9BACI|nr:hypothetical protein [Radiobacillus deserti]QDP41457.1 hypothetical protein FN924_15505 [Radiobacillus deserti]